VQVILFFSKFGHVLSKAKAIDDSSGHKQKSNKSLAGNSPQAYPQKLWLLLYYQHSNSKNMFQMNSKQNNAQGDLMKYKELSYRRGTARCVVSIEILPIAMQQCRYYLYDKS